MNTEDLQNYFKWFNMQIMTFVAFTGKKMLLASHYLKQWKRHSSRYFCPFKFKKIFFMSSTAS